MGLLPKARSSANPLRGGFERGVAHHREGDEAVSSLSDMGAAPPRWLGPGTAQCAGYRAGIGRFGAVVIGQVLSPA